MHDVYSSKAGFYDAVNAGKKSSSLFAGPNSIDSQLLA
jgi:hypothetical protein